MPFAITGAKYAAASVSAVGTDTTITFAGVRNNSALTTATAAWASRASLVYGDLSAA